MVDQLDYLLNQAHAPQSDGLLNRGRGVFHLARSFSRHRPGLQRYRFVGPINSLRLNGKFSQAVAGSGSCPRAKCGGVRKESRASLAPSRRTAASSPRATPRRISRWKQVVRRRLGGWSRVWSTHSTLAGGNPPPQRGAEGPDLESGSPPACRTQLAAARPEEGGRVIDVAAAPRRSGRRGGRGNAESSLSASLPDRRSVRNIHGGGRSPNNRRDTPDAFLRADLRVVESEDFSTILTTDQAALFRAPRGYRHLPLHQRHALTPPPQFAALQQCVQILMDHSKRPGSAVLAAVSGSPGSPPQLSLERTSRAAANSNCGISTRYPASAPAKPKCGEVSKSKGWSPALRSRPMMISASLWVRLVKTVWKAATAIDITANDEASYAGPVALDRNRDALPALAGATGSTLNVSFLRAFSLFEERCEADDRDDT